MLFRMASFAMTRTGLIQWLWQWIARFWHSLPEVRPYTGPASMRADPGQRVMALNGRIVVLRGKGKRDGTATPQDIVGRG